MTPPETTASDATDEEEADDYTEFKFIVNPAVIKGAAIAAVGLFILLSPSVSAAILKPMLSLVLIGIGLSDLWAWLRRPTKRTLSRLLLPLLSVTVGVSLLLHPAGTLEAITTILAIYLLIRGLGAALRLLFRRSDLPIVDVISAGIQLSLGALLLFVPQEIVRTLLGTIGLAALVLGGIILAIGLSSRSSDRDVDAAALATIAKSWLKSRDVGSERRAALSEDLYFENPGKISKLTAWWVMLVLSVAIATYAIIQDSTAVVIGAMLIAPLMTPIVGASAAIVNGRAARLIRSLALVGAGVFVAILLAYVIGKWTPPLLPLDTNAQVTSRTSPNIIDMAIALAAGAAGAFAMINRRVASGLAGVAIAVALVPPLGVVGITLEAGDADSAFGAFLLFITNLVAILLSATVVFAISGWTSVARIRSQASSIALTVGVIIAAAMVVMLPLVFTSEGILSTATKQGTATEQLEKWLDETAPDLTLDLVEVEGDIVLADVSGPGTLGDPAELESELTSEFDSSTTVQITLTPTTVVTYSRGGGTKVEDPAKVRPKNATTQPPSEPAPTDESSPQPSTSSSASPSPTSS
jgi:uncharacterized hydrophobic protein (TIGR00271 family)